MLEVTTILCVIIVWATLSFSFRCKHLSIYYGVARVCQENRYIWLLYIRGYITKRNEIPGITELNEQGHDAKWAVFISVMQYEVDQMFAQTGNVEQSVVGM